MISQAFKSAYYESIYLLDRCPFLPVTILHASMQCRAWFLCQLIVETTSRLPRFLQLRIQSTLPPPVVLSTVAGSYLNLKPGTR